MKDRDRIWSKALGILKKTARGLVILFLGFSVLMLPANLVLGDTPQSPAAATTITFTGEELLGIPTDTSITINIIPVSTIEYHYQYGTATGVYGWLTTNYTATGGQPHEVVINGLDPNTQYYYRMRYHLPGETDWVVKTEHTFWTQRAAGSTFSFSVTSDSHATFNAAHQNTMTNIFNQDPDFEVDLGDTFYPGAVSTQTAVNNKYLAYREPLYMDRIGPSVPIFLSAGNHEEEEGWNLDDTPFSIGVGSIQARKAYFPTPINSGFYSGNTDTLAAIDDATYGDKLREDYYAWTWGDALFVVIDPFQYTMDNTYGAIAGEGSDDPISGDQWSWTLGRQQYDWLKEVLETSDAKYKFMFSHNMVGGIPRDISVNPAGYVRGGAEAAGYFEWGGRNAAGTDVFDTMRPGWGDPIHELMVENGVSAYFHGHDHQYVYETRDNIVYQEVPSPSMSGSGFSGIYTEGDHGTYNTVRMLANAGHLLITVNPTQATVQYVSASNTNVPPTVNYTYTIAPNASVTTHVLTTAVSPGGAGTIDPAAGDHTYDEGTVVNITATPNPGYQFSSWSGDCTGTGACSVTMTADMDVTANFVINTPTKLGDVNGDGTVNSTDSLIILSGSVGINIVQFCPINCGDTNADGLVDSTDALIILSYSVGMTVPFPIGQVGACPVNVTPCAGCTPLNLFLTIKR